MLIEQRLGRLAGDHAIGDRVGMAFVAIAGLADAALQVNAAALLDDVRRLVRRGVQRWCAVECDVIARRERLGAHRARALAGGAIGVRRDPADVVAPERLLDLREIRQRATGATRAALRRIVDGAATRRGRLGFELALREPALELALDPRGMRRGGSRRRGLGRGRHLGRCGSRQQIARLRHVG